MSRLAGKTCIVTGAARGIGRAICEAFAQQGGRVYGLDRLTWEADTTAREGGRIVPILCDLADPDSISGQIGRIFEVENQVDVLVNNAAMESYRGKITELSLARWNEEIGINLTASFLMTRAVLPRMKAGGSVINMASTYAHVGAPDLAVYSATKGAILAFTRALALDYASAGIRFNTLSPGPILTERLLVKYGSRDAVQEVFAGRVPMGRPGAADEIAEAALYLASSQSSFMTGSDLRVDGGYCAR